MSEQGKKARKIYGHLASDIDDKDCVVIDLGGFNLTPGDVRRLLGMPRADRFSGMDLDNRRGN